MDRQEKVVGRRKSDSGLLPGGASATSHKEKSTVTLKDGSEVKILRRSFPFANKDEAGLLFLCWVRDLSQYEAVKGKMVGNKRVGKDAIEAFYTTVAGGYYFAPPVPEDGFVGDVLVG